MIARRFRRVAVPLLVAAAGLGLTACTNSVSDAATVTYHDSSGSHTVHITRASLNDDLRILVGNGQFTQVLKSTGIYPNLIGDFSTDSQLSSRWLSQLISQVVVDQEIAEHHLTVTPDETSTALSDSGQSFPGFATFPKAFANALVAREARTLAVYTYYSTCPSGRFVSHILLKTKAEADAALAELHSGKSFAAVAKALSIDTTSGAQGGALGCLSPEEFVAPFQTAAESAPLGVVTDPVQSQFGFHLILVRAWDPVRDKKAQSQNLTQAGLGVLQARVRELKVWLNPRYGTWGARVDAQGATSFGVAPPPLPQVRSCREDSAVCAPPTTTTTTTVPTAPGG